MTSTYHPSHLKERFAKQREKQKRTQLWWWRFFVVSSLTGGLLWASFLPQWRIEQPEQLDIQGNQYFTQEALRDILARSTYGSIIALSPSEMKTFLKKHAPITEATVYRNLYPPRVTVAVKERLPVAVTFSDVAENSEEKGYLDVAGIWMPAESFLSSDAVPTPDLKIIGYRAEYQSQWVKIYPLIQQLSIEVQTINWQDPSNLILETSLGSVHLGGNLESLPQQLEKLEGLESLPQKVSRDEIEHINLKNPNYPLVQIKSQSTTIAD